jgi:hypothetical protein
MEQCPEQVIRPFDGHGAGAGTHSGPRNDLVSPGWLLVREGKKALLKNSKYAIYV